MRVVMQPDKLGLNFYNMKSLVDRYHNSRYNNNIILYQIIQFKTILYLSRIFISHDDIIRFILPVRLNLYYYIIEIYVNASIHDKLNLLCIVLLLF